MPFSAGRGDGVDRALGQADGERGVQNVLAILRQGIDEALLGLGKASVNDLTREDVVLPPHFTRS